VTWLGYCSSGQRIPANMFEIPFSDGQAEAKRLAKSITSKTSNLKKQLVC